VALAMRVRLPRAPPGVIVAIGGLTYPVYLLHQHIGYMLLNRYADQATPALLIVLVMFVILAWSFVIWRVIETPAQRWTKNILSCGLQYINSKIESSASRLAQLNKLAT